MRRARIAIALTVFTATLTMAGPALAVANGGQGWWGETTDKGVTMVMFGVIAFFPVLIFVLSLIQWRLDKRKHARMDAERARSVSAEWRGGW